jgi:hypothetical protein
MVLQLASIDCQNGILGVLLGQDVLAVNIEQVHLAIILDRLHLLVLLDFLWKRHLKQDPDL